MTDTAPLLIDGHHYWLVNGRLRPAIAGAQEGGDGNGDGSGGEGGTGDGGQGGGDEGSGNDGGDNGTGDAGSGEAKLTLTQAELDDMIARRVSKAVKAKEDEARTAAERAKMDEAERLKAEKEDAEKAAADKVKGANARLVRTEAKVAALAAGVKADRIDRFLRLVDLDTVDVDDDGNVDDKAIAKAVESTLKDVPEFKAAANGASGGEFAGGNGDRKARSLEEAVTARVG